MREARRLRRPTDKHTRLEKNVTSDHAHTSARLPPPQTRASAGAPRRRRPPIDPRPPALKVPSRARRAVRCSPAPSRTRSPPPRPRWTRPRCTRRWSRSAPPSRAAGTEAEALKNKKLGKAAPAPRRRPPPPKASASKKAPSGQKRTRRSAGALAAVVALGGVFAANASRGRQRVFGILRRAPRKPPAAAGGDTPAARASAQAWIDASDFGKSGGGAADTPEGRAADAQKWIDAWKKGQ